MCVALYSCVFTRPSACVFSESCSTMWRLRGIDGEGGGVILSRQIGCGVRRPVYDLHKHLRRHCGAYCSRQIPAYFENGAVDVAVCVDDCLSLEVAQIFVGECCHIGAEWLRVHGPGFRSCSLQRGAHICDGIMDVWENSVDGARY